MTLQSRAPTRIDLAGGTLDIWPLYLLVEPAATVNVAIDLYAEASFTPARGAWRVRDLDGGREVAASTPAGLSTQPGAEIAGTLLDLFSPEGPLSVATRSMAPPRSGLGASSALGIAIAGALNAMTGFPYDGGELVEIVKNAESRVLGAMTGAQDHYPAVYGGACCLWWGVRGARREPLPLEAELFEKHFLLVYSQQPHRSGVNNWEVIKRFLDGDDKTRRALGAIGEIAVRMRKALIEHHMDEVAILIQEEWEARQRLAPAVTSPELDRLLEAALSAGARSGKACGAGGGGCLLVAVEPGARGSVEQAVRQAGGAPVAFRVARQGLRLDNPARAG